MKIGSIGTMVMGVLDEFAPVFALELKMKWEYRSYVFVIQQKLKVECRGNVVHLEKLKEQAKELISKDLPKKNQVDYESDYSEILWIIENELE